MKFHLLMKAGKILFFQMRYLRETEKSGSFFLRALKKNISLPDNFPLTFCISCIIICNTRNTKYAKEVVLW